MRANFEPQSRPNVKTVGKSHLARLQAARPARPLLHPPKSQDRHLKSNPWLNTRKTASERERERPTSNLTLLPSSSLLWAAPPDDDDGGQNTRFSARFVVQVPKSPLESGLGAAHNNFCTKIYRLRFLHFRLLGNVACFVSWPYLFISRLDHEPALFLPKKRFFPPSLRANERVGAYLRISDNQYQPSSHFLPTRYAWNMPSIVFKTR